MAAPSMSKAAAGNVVNAASLAASGTNTYALYGGASGAGNVNLATDTVFETQVQVDILTGGSVSTTWGATVSAYRGGTSSGSGATNPVWDTQTGYSTQIGGSGTGSASTHYRQTLFLPTAPGWQIVVKNNDNTNGLTLTISADQLSSVA